MRRCYIFYFVVQSTKATAIPAAILEKKTSLAKTYIFIFLERMRDVNYLFFKVSGYKREK